MTLAVIPSGFCQANLRFTGAAVPRGAEITLGLDPGGVIANDPVVIANAVADAFTPTVMTVLVDTITLSEVYVKMGPNDTGPSGSAFRAVAGSDPSAAVTPNTSALVVKTTSGGGRRSRGRFYCPGISEEAIDPGGVLTTSYLNALQVQWDVFYGNVETADLAPVLLHSPGISATPEPTPILAFTVQALVATQRDRLR